ncbi:MAG: HlyD family efflux transporter periplasmic adaptor subunit [Spirochaetia bacterium]|nr:HlyD family efflux transporter periplasmic adaptor subunit [Spirochaetia bacterium]
MIEDTKKTEHSILKDLKKKPYKSPGQKRQQVIALIVVLMVALVSVVAYFMLMPKEQVYVLKTYDSAVVQEGSLVRKIQAGGAVSIPLQVIVTAPDVGDGAYVQQLLVKQGDYVEKNQVLAILGVPTLIDQLRELEEEYEEAKISYEQFVQQNAFSIARSDRELARLVLDIEEAESEVEKQSQLYAVNAARKSDYDRALKTLENLRFSYDEKVIQLEESKILNKINESNRLSALDRYQKNIARIETSINDATILSPIEGEILALDSRLTVPGSTINKSQSLFTVADRTSAIIELDVPQQHAGLLKIGQQVSLSVGGRPLIGTIESIGRVALMSSDGITATVQVIVLPEQGSDLIPGSTAVSELVIGTLDDILLLPRGPYLTTGGQRFVYVIEGNQGIKTAVTYGELHTDQVQILGGLSEGDRIITSGYQNYIEHNTIMLQGAEK